MPKPRPRYRLFNQDCLEVVPDLPPKSIDTVITDPPYGLDFMGKEWDHGIPGMLFWARIRKVCKSGALLLAFGGTRTYHRLACAIEDGGWQIRDCMMWLYGSGFPKSYDISKGLDADAGAEREVLGIRHTRTANKKYGGGKGTNLKTLETVPSTSLAKEWEGYDSALKPAWEPIIVAMKPFRGTFVDNALAYAVAGFNVDAGRIRTTGRWPANLILQHHPECVQVGVKKVKGNAGMNFYRRQGKPIPKSTKDPTWFRSGSVNEGACPVDADGLETVEAWECHEDCPVGMLDQQSGIVGGGSHTYRRPKPTGRKGKIYGAIKHDQPGTSIGIGDTGGASRFFYCAKASKRERNYGLEGLKEKNLAGANKWTDCDYRVGEGEVTAKPQMNHHPTVKPLGIMEYLCRLTRPPSGGTVFDPFMGSGTTGVACARTRRKFIGCEIDTEEGYFEIARRRIRKAYKSA